MWIILLDRSGSMRNPFQGTTRFSGRTRTAVDERKIDAAKRALIEYAQGLSKEERISVVAFNNKSKEVFQGTANESQRLKDAIDGIEARGGTDIPLALFEAASICEKHASQEPIVRVLLISDGLSNNPEIEPAVENLTSLRVTTDVILIDPTERGEKIARLIARFGNVSAVVSPVDLHKQVESFRDSYHHAAKQAEKEIQKTKKDIKKVVREDLVDVSFTAGYPNIIQKGKWYPVWFFIHLAELGNEVNCIIGDAAKQQDFIATITTTPSDTRLKRGTAVRIVPQARHILFDPIAVEIIWSENIHRVNFRLYCNREASDSLIHGSIDVLVDGVLIGAVPVAFRISTRSVKTGPSNMHTKGTSMFRTVFASYSHSDKAIVDRCVNVYRALGIYVFVDKDSLLSGQDFERRIFREIENTDLFQLYWSFNALASEWVTKEWNYARKLANSVDRKGENFIRPVVWEPPKPPPLPEPLSHLHYGNLNLNLLGLFSSSSNIERTGSSVTDLRFTTKVLPAACPVLPIVSSDVTHIEQVKEDTANAVQFLNSVTGLGYQPVPTLLVDEYTVVTSRQVTTSDSESIELSLREVVAICEFLRSLMLGVHVRQFRPPDLDYDTVRNRIKPPKFWSKDAYQQVMRDCEGYIFKVLRECFLPVWMELRDRLSKKVPGLSDMSMSQFISWYLQAISNLHEQLRYREKLGSQGLKKKDLEKAKKYRPDLIESLSVRQKKGIIDDIEYRAQASFPLLSSLYKEAHDLLMTQIDDLTPQRLEGFNPPEFAASCFLGIADTFLGDYVLNVGTVWPNSLKLRDGSYLDKDGAEILLRSVSPPEMLKPKWIELKDEWAHKGLCPQNTDMQRFAAIMLNRVEELLDSLVSTFGEFTPDIKYSVPKEDWEIVQSKLGSSLIAKKVTSEFSFANESEKVLLKGKSIDFIETFQASKKALLGALAWLKRNRTSVYYTISSTYGLFINYDLKEADRVIKKTCKKLRVPLRMAMPKTPRVLLCLDALDQHKDLAPDLNESLRLTTTLHEHFHASIVCSPRPENYKGPEPPPDTRQQIHALEEALAAWMELHYAREIGNIALFNAVKGYVLAGDWPTWPYRGAFEIDRLYREQGIDAIKNTIYRLRNDPASVAIEFDQRMKMPAVIEH
jgi:hypothetical protein